MKNKRAVGIHLRIENSYTEMLEQTIQFGANACQFFFMPQDTNKYLKLTDKDQEAFLALKHKHKTTVFAHSSYWINPASGNPASARASHRMLKQEIEIAKKLDINHIVMHAGSAKGHEKEAGIQAVATLLNTVLQDEKEITILIENTAHAGKTVCSNLEDFVALQSLLTTTNVKFCLDTAHAYSYGYDLKTTDLFLKLLEQTMGLEHIKLIHLNNSAKPSGSKIDQHELPDQGLIGETVLQNIINSPKLKTLPIIIEPPIVSLEELKKTVSHVRNW
ncbi:deoxyribonuclease IV [Candidatus Dependentiae bacterium]|nr:deoxyribonuclease IV [Candidatus Dependentiae bacterium]